MSNKTKYHRRYERLMEMGLEFNGGSFIKDDFNVHYSEVTCSTDEEFDKIVENIEKEMERRKEVLKLKRVPGEITETKVKSKCPHCGYAGVQQVENDCNGEVECWKCEKKYIVITIARDEITQVINREGD